MKKIIIPDETGDCLIEEFNRGTKVKHLCDKFGYSRSKIYHYLRSRRDEVLYHRLDLSHNLDARAIMRSKVKNLYEEGKTVAEIAKVLEVTVTWIYILLRDMGVRPITGNFELKRHTYSIPSETWAAEFRGFFMGDGSVVFGRIHYREDGSFNLTPILTIGLRADDAALLQEIHRVFGGSLSFSHRFENPQIHWRVSGWSTVHSIILATGLDKCHLPFKKSRDFQIMMAAIEARSKMPFKYGDDGKIILEDFCSQLKAVKRYSVVKVPVA